MAVLVELDDEDIQSQRDGQVWDASEAQAHKARAGSATNKDNQEAHEYAVKEVLNQNHLMIRALGCYPIAQSVARNLDLNSLDSLSRTCRILHSALLQDRRGLINSSLRCSLEDVTVDPQDTLRFRARSANWYYGQDSSARTDFQGKSGQCARDLVGPCRRCGTIVCRNCAIKPPAQIVLRDRHRRLCTQCVKAPLGQLVKPPMGPEVRIDSDDMQRAICQCGSSGVWLCFPCGRSIRNDDNTYQSVWKWRNQYTDVLSGLGTGIGDGDRGVQCGRNSQCCGAREVEQETDYDAEAAREAADQQLQQDRLRAGLGPRSDSSASTSTMASGLSAASNASLSSLASNATGGSGSSTLGGLLSAGSDHMRRTPSPAMKVGYVRHEVEGIGGVMKKISVKRVKVGACVPEWDEERLKGEILGREVQGKRRSWCGWCSRVIPGQGDYELDRHGTSDWKDEDSVSSWRGKGKGKGKEAV
ncbi:hypothetical protein QBC41DRAFT_314919 [Cercophora samala]|uniref:Uncharacterized protein n=1 Tax=Cercophora samala TaxID=330535 RepID=A0AA40DE58_9PEZI|nr:hypothetical protein QBC41DRAFT_314919 [Cercophora samala]